MISVCMAYYMRQPQLDYSLEQYAALYTDLEISICDDGSPEPLRVPHDYPFPIMTSNLPRKSYSLCPCRPINQAVNQSSGGIIVITNPEVFHVEPVFRKMLGLIRNDDDYVIAACKDHTGRWLAHSQTPDLRINRPPYPAGSDMHYCVMLTRALWNRVGGFDEDFREGAFCDDIEWVWQLHAAGARFIMRDDLVTYSQKHPRSPWIAGGQERNQRLLKEKWGHEWKNRS